MIFKGHQNDRGWAFFFFLFLVLICFDLIQVKMHLLNLLLVGLRCEKTKRRLKWTFSTQSTAGETGNTDTTGGPGQLAPLLFLCHMKTMLPLEGGGGGRARFRVGGRGWACGGKGLKTRLLIPQEVCKRHARVTPNPSQHTDAFTPTHTEHTLYTQHT